MNTVSEREFLEFVSSVLAVSAAALSLDTAYESIPQWDSVMHIRLVMEVEAHWKVDIPLETIPNLLSLRAFYQFLTAGGSETSPVT